MLRSGGLITFFFFLAATVYGQGWQMYAEQIKEEAANRRKNQALIQEQGMQQTLPEQVSGAGERIPQPKQPKQTKYSNSQKSAPASFLSMPELDITYPEEDADNENNHVATDETVNAINSAPEQSSRTPSLPGVRDFPEMKKDATLQRLTLTPAGIAWIVGDRGTIVASADHGQSWSLIHCPVDCNLYDVCFQDERVGVIVGGRILPSGDGIGVILRTEDGGATWREVPTLSFPILRQISLNINGSLIVSGDSSELYPAGIFTSGDQGMTWTADTGNRHEGWQRLFYNSVERTGFGLGTEGTILTTTNGRCGTRHPVAAYTRIHDMTPAMAGHFLAVGDHGLILDTPDGGGTWRSLAGALPSAVTNLFDFKTVLTQGNNIWVAGSPGSVIFKSSDGGQSWRPVPTGITATLQSMQFWDEQHGLAVGELGTILKTDDGGLHWTTLRKGGDRLALLGLFGYPQDIPWEILVRYCAEEGYLGGIALLAREEAREKTNNAVPNSLRVLEATVNSGASTVDTASTFLLDPDELAQSVDGILARFDRENDRKGLDAFRDSMVRLIRTRRPNVIIIQSEKTSPLAGLISRELPGAIRSAAEPLAFPDQLQDGFLAPWQVEKVCCLSDDNPETTPMAFESGTFCPTLGRNIRELAREVRCLLNTEPVVPDKTFLTVLYDRQAAVTTGQPTSMNRTSGLADGLFTGVTPPVVGESRRKRGEGLSARRDELIHRAAEIRQKEGIAARTTRSGNNERSGDILLPQIRTMIQGVDAEAALEFLMETARGYRDRGNWTAAEEVYSLAVQEFPRHPMLREALLWLIPWYAGSEPIRRSTLFQRDSITATLEAGRSGRIATTDPIKKEARLRNAEELGKLIREYHPDLYMKPEIRFPLAAAARLRGWSKNATGYYMNRGLISSDDLWGLRANAEFWLATPNKDTLTNEQQVCPSSILNCRAVVQRPKLDGILEPEFWSNAQTVTLSTDPQNRPVPQNTDEIWNRSMDLEKYAANYGSSISLLYDKQYLYIALVCNKMTGVDYTPYDNPRVRDGTRNDADRIEIQLDADRDYTTFYRFVFDYAGRTSESLWNDLSWNPRLYVAQRQDEESWTIEAAIPWSELADEVPSRSDVWAVSVRRIVPGTGIECWNSQFSQQGKNGFGFLTFGF